ncbi:MAG: hypothetical protein CML24_11625 [Rhizobiales bacterium]|nr:hypothetical protein [Hyphomicrobiales bacterium]
MTRAVVSLCDLTGNFVRPWAEAGYECFCVDIEHSIRRDRVEQVGAGRIHYVWGDVRTWAPPAGVEIVFGAAWTPCTNVAGSGARDFAKKGGYMLRDALEMFEAGRQVLKWSGAPSFSENPVGVLSSIPHTGKPDHYFDPSDYAALCEDDNYSKKTCVWAYNGFVMPEKCPAPWLGEPDDRIHKATPGDGRADFRSAPPMGFSRAVFNANAPHLRAVKAA